MVNDFTKYDRITDILLYFNSEITLNFVVALSRNTLSGERRFYHYEIAKPSAKRGEGELYNIKRSMNFFFTIDIKNDFLSNFIIRPRDAQMLNQVIDRDILPWYQSGSDRYAFQIVKGNLALTEYTPVLYAQSEIKYLQFEPCVILDKNDKYSFGININICGKYFVQIELDKFMDFVYILHTDMYNAACSLCNYAKIQPYGVNQFKPYGLGGGRVEDQFVEGEFGEDPQASYTSTTINSAPREESKNNSFLESSKSRKRGE